MQVRVFTAEDMNAGLRQVRKELGPEALILSTKTIKNGALGIFEKATIEITAAIDSPYPEQGAIAKQNNVKNPPAYGTTETKRESPQPLPRQQAKKITAKHYNSVQENDTEEPPLYAEVEALQEMVGRLAQRIANDATPQKNKTKIFTEILAPYFRAQGIAENAAQHLGDKILDGIEDPDPATLYQRATETLATLIKVAPPDFSQLTGQKRIALIGPTGVGKTTTLAKLAALFLADQSNDIALITIDTYRIAAVEQLKVYGTIMQVPVEVVLSPEELRAALERHSDKSLILIDTAGRSPKDSIAIADLSGFLEPDLGIEKHLVLSAATREQELLDIIAQFETVGFERLLFTKVDECLTTGAIFSVHLENSTPLSFITNGQRVPEDLLIATPRCVAELILPPHGERKHEQHQPTE